MGSAPKRWRNSAQPLMGAEPVTGPLGFEPGPPAPQARVIIRQHGENPVILDLTIVLDDEPAYAEYNNRIIKTLQQMASDGRKKATLKSAIWTLRQINKHTDLMNPEAVKKYISELKNKNNEQPQTQKNTNTSGTTITSSKPTV